MEISEKYPENQRLKTYNIIKHITGHKIQNMMDIKKALIV